MSLRNGKNCNFTLHLTFHFTPWFQVERTQGLFSLSSIYVPRTWAGSFAMKAKYPFIILRSFQPWQTASKSLDDFFLLEHSNKRNEVICHSTSPSTHIYLSFLSLHEWEKVVNSSAWMSYLPSHSSEHSLGLIKSDVEDSVSRLWVLKVRGNRAAQAVWWGVALHLPPSSSKLLGKVGVVYFLSACNCDFKYGILRRERFQAEHSKQFSRITKTQVCYSLLTKENKRLSHNLWPTFTLNREDKGMNRGNRE